MKNKKISENIIVIFSLFFIFYLLIKNAIHAPFTVDDEYNNFYWANPGLIFGPERGYFQTLIDSIVGFLRLGRLLIIHLTVIIARAKLFGVNPLLHHWLVFIFGLTTAFFVYKVFEKAAISKQNSFIGAILYLTGYAYAEIFFRLSSGECTGNLFLLISVYFIVSFSNNNKPSNFYWSALFAFFTALSKESYLILFPLIFAIPFLFMDLAHWKSFIINNKFKVYLVGSIFAVLILGLFVTIKYSGIVFSYGQPLSKLDTFINNSIWLFKWFLLFLPVVLFALFDYLKKNNFRTLIPLMIFIAGWIIAQLVVYNKVIISFSQGRYMMPAGLVLILSIVLALEHFKLTSKLGYKIVLLVTLLLIVRNAKIVYINANEFNAKATAYNNLIDRMVESKADRIAVYGGVEFFQSIKTYFIAKNYSPKLITTDVVYPEGYTNDYSDENYKNELQNILNMQHEHMSLEELKKDSTLHFMIVAEPEEYLPINYKAVMKTFKHIERIGVNFSNPGFGDLIKKDFWTGNLGNSQRTYIIFTK